MTTLAELIKYLILQQLNQWYPMGLSPGNGEDGAPFDEYMQYALSTQNYFQSNKLKLSAKSLADFIALEFSQAFDAEFKADDGLISIAENIIYHSDLLRAQYHKQVE